MKFQYDRGFKFNLNGDDWEAYLVTKEELIEHYAEDGETEPDAFVDTENRCLFVSERCVSKEILGHELLHMFVESFHINSANLDVDQFEEIIAEFLGYSVDKFIKTRNQLYKKFKKFEGV